MVSLISGIIPLLIVAALMGNRTDLLQLKRRGLWEGVFGPEHPTQALCWIGGILMVGGYLMFYASFLIPAIGAAKNAKIRHDFAELIQVDEKDFLDAMPSASQAPTPTAFDELIAKLDRIDSKARAISDDAPGTFEFTNIETYRKGLAKWRSGLQLIHDLGPGDASRARLAEGDALRQEALSDFDTHAMSPGEWH